jgi:hypothetical protein
VVVLDISQLKEYISNEPTNIQLLLENAGFYKVRKQGNKYFCGWTYEGTGTSVQIDIHDCTIYDFSIRKNGDIITLIQDKLRLNFKDAINWITSELGISDFNFKKRDIVLPFGGYFKNIAKADGNDSHVELRKYDENILNDFYKNSSILFYNDGINIDTQNKYQIMYDNYTSRIVVPWRDSIGNLIGIMGRYNNRIIPSEMSKWFPIIPFSKSKVLYGYSENYSAIQAKRVCIIGESEKFPMQLSSMGCGFGIATGGCSIHDPQIKSLLSLNAEKYIIAYDEGLEEDYIRNEAEKLVKNNPFYKHKVGYIYDKSGLYLPKDSKYSPTDLGKDGFNKLYKERIVWI